MRRLRRPAHRSPCGLGIACRPSDDSFRLRRILELLASGAVEGADLSALVTVVEHGERTAGEWDWFELMAVDL